MLTGWWASLTVVDITILGTLLVAFLVGWTTGIIRFLTSFLSFIIAVVVAGRFGHHVVGWLNTAFGAQGWLEGVITRRIHLPVEAGTVPVSAIPLSTAIKWLNAIPVPEFYRAPLAQQLTEWSTAAGNKTAAEFLIEQVAAGFLNVVVFALLVTILSVLLSLLGRLIAEQVQEIPVIGTIDRLAGALALLLQAALVLSIVTVFVVPMLTMYGATELGEAFAQAKTVPFMVGFFEWIRGVLFGGGTRLWNV